MANPNRQPTGSRPGPKAPHTHAPYSGRNGGPGFVPDASQPNPGHPGAGGPNGVASHGTPKGVGSNKKNPMR